MGATLLSTAYWAERTTPSEAPDFEVTNLTVAFLAMAPAHSTSIVDSSLVLAVRQPGVGTVHDDLRVVGSQRQLLRKVRTSVRLMSARPSTAIL